jgi:hypothetical protein
VAGHREVAVEFILVQKIELFGLWDYTLARAVMFVLLVGFCAAVLWYTSKAKQGKDLYVRPIAGLAAMNEAVGRATEMGRPVLYVPGIAPVDDIQTIASITILSEVAKLAASYDTRTIVPTRDPIVFPLAEETVRNACADAGRPDVFRADDVRFLSDDQFAFTAGVTGIMLREKPAANIYFGAFWAESLILAETGFSAGAIQIAGTANVSQLPFFVAACDFTLIGEELYAASAYLSREPKLLGSLKASDLAKLFVGAFILIGVLAANFEFVDDFFGLFGADSFKAFFSFN